MNNITQDLKYRQSILSYAEKHGVTKAATKYRTNRQYIYRWRRRYDGTLDSLRYRSRRPHSYPKQHTEKEMKLIRDMRRRNPLDGLVVFWVKLRQRGYTCSISCLYRCIRRMGLKQAVCQNPKKYTPKLYKEALFPGEKVQIDVKVVPKICITGKVRDEGLKLYQYTTIDECTRFRYLEGFDEQSTYSSMLFLQHLIKRFPFTIRKVQTDNGVEFTKRFTKDPENDETLFEKELRRHGIEHQKIRPYTPRHNGKVERSHRKDNRYFYAKHTFYSLDDFNQQLKEHTRRYNNFPMRPLRWKSQKESLQAHLESV